MHDSPEPLKNRPTGQAPDYMLGRCSQLKTRTSSYQFESYVFLNLDSIFS